MVARHCKYAQTATRDRPGAIVCAIMHRFLACRVFLALGVRPFACMDHEPKKNFANGNTFGRLSPTSNIKPVAPFQAAAAKGQYREECP